MWGDYYPEDDRRAPYFEVRCEACGATRRNDEGDFCQCGSSHTSHTSYQNADARRWNRYADRGRW